MIKNKQNLNIWLSVGITNAIALYIASLIFPTGIVFGNESISNWMAVLLTALLLTVVLMLVKPVLKSANLKMKGDLLINITYCIANIAGIWASSRLSIYVGFGVSSLVVVIVLGVVLTLLQYIVWKAMAGKK